jgi:hypothetical protein
MTESSYRELDLIFENTDDGCVCRMPNAVGGEVRGRVFPSFSAAEMATWTKTFAAAQAGDAGAAESAGNLAYVYGRRLFEAIFRHELLTALQESRRIAFEQRAALRLRIDTAATPELAQFPWEFLFDAGRDEYVALSEHSPLSRYTGLMHHVLPIKPDGPLRVLVVAAQPSSYPTIHADAEWMDLVDTLDALGRERKLTLERLTKPTLLDLQRRLRQGQYHIVHFIGHGAPDRQTSEGQLVFEDEAGRGRLVSGEHLGSLLRDHYTLRLICLTGSESVAYTPGEHPYTSVAQRLIRRGAAAVVAPRLEASQTTILTFLRRFYTAIAEEMPVDLAMVEARRAIQEEEEGALWGAPLLYMRVPDGRLFGDERPNHPELPASVTNSVVSRLNSLRIRTATRSDMARWGMEPKEPPKS